MSGDPALRDRIGALLGANVETLRPVGGGDICRAFEAMLSSGERCFVKTLPGAPPGFFATEAAGLRWLSDAAALPVPEVLATAEDLLALSWVEAAPRTPAADEAFGRGLARLHRAGADAFGAAPDAGEQGWIGTVPVENRRSVDGAAWWVDRRLLPLVRRAVGAGSMPPEATGLAARVAGRLAALLNVEERPARLHGDLWSGNVIWTGGSGVLVDPAAHGGFRETDLAMMQLFGGFGPAVLAAYRDEWPLAAGWRERLEALQLVPLLVHGVLFGASYGRRALELLRRFT